MADDEFEARAKITVVDESSAVMRRITEQAEDMARTFARMAIRAQADSAPANKVPLPTGTTASVAHPALAILSNEKAARFPGRPSIEADSCAYIRQSGIGLRCRQLRGAGDRAEPSGQAERAGRK
jgi:hypothetical protein